MDLKKKMKNFFTLTRKANGGFTLVELIVVIAILAILGGVAVPAYSGYIEKADRAADAQLLADVNKAFAAACMVEGLDNYNASGATASIGNDKKIDTITFPNFDTNKFNATFDSFFDNEGEFKKFEELYYETAIGGFAEEYSVTVTYNGKELTFSASQINALKNSTFLNAAKGLGLDKLLGKLDFVTGFAEALLTPDGENQSSALNAVIADPIFQRTFAGYLGIDTTNLSDEEVSDAIFRKYTDEDGNHIISKEKQQSMMANALVLYAAQNSTMTKQDATSLLTGDAKKSILATLNGSNDTAANTPAAMAQAALAYGMYTSYAHYTGDQTLIDKAASPNALDVMNMLNDDNFKTYISGPQGQQDLDGYLNAMDMIDTAAKDNTVAGGVLDNGFTDEELGKLLGDILK